MAIAVPQNPENKTTVCPNESAEKVKAREPKSPSPSPGVSPIFIRQGHPFSGMVPLFGAVVFIYLGALFDAMDQLAQFDVLQPVLFNFRIKMFRDSEKVKSILERERHLIKVVVVVLSAFVICWTPFWTVSLVSTIHFLCRAIQVLVNRDSGSSLIGEAGCINI